MDECVRDWKQVEYQNFNTDKSCSKYATELQTSNLRIQHNVFELEPYVQNVSEKTIQKAL